MNTISCPQVPSPKAMGVFSCTKRIGETYFRLMCRISFYFYQMLSSSLVFMCVIGYCFLKVTYSHINFLKNCFLFFPDLSAVDNSVFLELFRLDRNLPLYCYLYFPWSWLSSVYLYSYLQTSTTRHSTAHPDSRSSGLPKSKCLSIWRESN